MKQRPFSQPHPLADAATLKCKLAKESLRGEGQDEGELFKLVAERLCCHPHPAIERRKHEAVRIVQGFLP